MTKRGGWKDEKTLREQSRKISKAKAKKKEKERKEQERQAPAPKEADIPEIDQDIEHADDKDYWQQKDEARLKARSQSEREWDEYCEKKDSASRVLCPPPSPSQSNRCL